MKMHMLIVVAGLALLVAACDDELTPQLKRLQALLQSQDFALDMASFLDAAYYRGQDQTPPPFLQPGEDTATIQKSVKEEKIAINLAGFYALESGIGLLAERTKQMPADILDAITQNRLAADDMLVLARFANATWKAGQPFRALNRITRDTFKPAILLTDDDVKKDVVQIKAAAWRLSGAMQDVRGQGRLEQLNRLQALLQNPDFALDMAAYLDAAYYGGLRQTPPPFLRPEDETAVTRKSVREEKIAINLAGFYAVEVGATLIGERTRELPLTILSSIAEGRRSTDDMLLLARFANATWKAGQPFRSLGRITRANFIPAALLSNDELKKDFDQIKAAAQKLRDTMARN